MSTGRLLVGLHRRSQAAPRVLRAEHRSRPWLPCHVVMGLFCTVATPAKVRCLTAPVLGMSLQNFRESVVPLTLEVVKLACLLRLRRSTLDKNLVQ